MLEGFNLKVPPGKNPRVGLLDRLLLQLHILAFFCVELAHVRFFNLLGACTINRNCIAMVRCKVIGSTGEGHVYIKKTLKT